MELHQALTGSNRQWLYGFRDDLSHSQRSETGRPASSGLIGPDLGLGFVLIRPCVLGFNAVAPTVAPGIDR